MPAIVLMTATVWIQTHVDNYAVSEFIDLRIYKLLPAGSADFDLGTSLSWAQMVRHKPGMLEEWIVWIVGLLDLVAGRIITVLLQYWTIAVLEFPWQTYRFIYFIVNIMHH